MIWGRAGWLRYPPPHHHHHHHHPCVVTSAVSQSLWKRAELEVDSKSRLFGSCRVLVVQDLMWQNPASVCGNQVRDSDGASPFPIDAYRDPVDSKKFLLQAGQNLSLLPIVMTEDLP